MIQPNRYQPRLRFSDNELEDMARSIRQQGIIQPLLVRKDNNGYELIAGERRAGDLDLFDQYASIRR